MKLFKIENIFLKKQNRRLKANFLKTRILDPALLYGKLASFVEFPNPTPFIPHAVSSSLSASQCLAVAASLSSTAAVAVVFYPIVLPEVCTGFLISCCYWYSPNLRLYVFSFEKHNLGIF